MKNDDMHPRTKDFALRIIRLYSALPVTTEAVIFGKQILRSGTSVGAHYRETRRGKSNAEFITKVEDALQRLGETSYWLELLGDSGIVKEELLTSLIDETNQLTAIFVAIVKSKSRKVVA